MAGDDIFERRTRQMLETEDSLLDSLPDDILMQILIRVPAQHIMAFAMRVCRKWYDMIHTREFIFAQLPHSTSGLLIRNLDCNGATFMSISSTNEIVISDFKYNILPEFWTSCNGLMLEAGSNDCPQLIITNPTTKQRFRLPTFTARLICSSAIACVPTLMEHKVVRTYNIKTRSYCAILTFGVDNSWRRIDTKHLSATASMQLNKCPLVTEGFVHWAGDWPTEDALQKADISTNKSNDDYVLTLNMETEIITRIPVPQCNGGYYYYKYFSGGSYLSLLIGRGYLKWEVWEMKPETGEWTKLPDIDLEGNYKDLLNQKCDRDSNPKEIGDCKLYPAGWLKYREVIVFVVYVPTGYGYGFEFRQARLRAAYNVQTQIITLFALHHRHVYPYLQHKNSLVGMLD